MFKKYSAIFLVLVLICNLGNSLKIQTQIKLNSLTASKVKVKSTVMVNLLEEVKNGNISDNRVYKVLKDKLKTVIDNQSSMDIDETTIYRKLANQCNQEVEFRMREIQNSKNIINYSQNTKDTCNKALETANIQLENLKSIKLRLEDSTTYIDQNMHERREDFQKRSKELNKAIEDAKEYQDYISNKLEGNVEFIQKSHLLLKHATNAGKLSASAPILMAI